MKKVALVILCLIVILSFTACDFLPIDLSFLSKSKEATNSVQEQSSELSAVDSQVTNDLESSVPLESSAVDRNAAVRYIDGPANIRSGPSTSYDVIASLETNTEVYLLGEVKTDSAGISWYYIEYPVNSKWEKGWTAENNLTLNKQ